MKILTVRQPWAWLIEQGIKDVENRSWSTMYRGPLAIHAGLIADESFETIYPPNVALPPAPSSLTRGAIVAVVDLIDVVTQATSDWALPDQFHWVLSNPRPITPIQQRGVIGLTRVPDYLEAEINESLREATAS